SSDLAVAPERVVQRLEYLGARVDGALPGRVGVLHGQVQRAVGAAQGQRRDDAHVRELVGDRQPAVAEGQLDGHYLAAGQGDPAFFRRVQDRLIPGGGCFWVPGHQVGSQRVHRQHYTTCLDNVSIRYAAVHGDV